MRSFAVYLLWYLISFNAWAESPPAHNTRVLVFANEAIVSVYSYDFANYRGQLQHASNYFTSEGWRAYIEALGDSGILDVVRDEAYVVSAVATAPPIITTQGSNNGQYAWEVEMPVLVQYRSSDKDKEQKQLLTIQLTIVATSETEGTRSLGILQFAAEPETTSELQELLF